MMRSGDEEIRGCPGASIDWGRKGTRCGRARRTRIYRPGWWVSLYLDLMEWRRVGGLASPLNTRRRERERELGEKRKEWNNGPREKVKI